MRDSPAMIGMAVQGRCFQNAFQFRGPGCHEGSPGCNVAHLSSQFSKSVVAGEGGGVVTVLRGAGGHSEWVSTLCV